MVLVKNVQESGPRLKVSPDRLVEPGIEIRTPGFKASVLSTTPRRTENREITVHLGVNSCLTISKMIYPCAESGIFVRGGGGVQVSSDNVFCFFSFFFVLSLFTAVKWSISKKSIIFQVQRGCNIFQGWGVQLFPGGGGGSNCLFSLETHITCVFSRGSGPPAPPLWIRT